MQGGLTIALPSPYIFTMKQFTALMTAALLAASPLSADEGSPPLPPEDELEQLGDLAESWMKRFADRMSPMVEQLKDLVDDMNAYQAPEMLPNGDIIIRRKPDADTTEDEPPSIEL